MSSLTIEIIASKENLTSAYMQVIAGMKEKCSRIRTSKENKRLAWEIRKYEEDKKKKIMNLRRKLRNGQYSPLPFIKSKIPKRDSFLPNHFPIGESKKYRDIFEPEFIDKVALRALKQVVGPEMENLFLKNNHGWRESSKVNPCKSAVDMAKDYIREGNIYCRELDINNCFLESKRQLVLDLFSRQIDDPAVLELISKALNTKYRDRGRIRTKTQSFRVLHFLSWQLTWF